ncbi:MAG TPA: 16S rRNA (guanine(527)-N(7))-methyltransferase RsmG [Sphingomonas sp.]|nr:16S rRNA (guanine(527)-N(7))-methyltransferase RsmG [Sphingomonas sp.]
MAARNVPRETFEALDRFTTLLRREAQTQNLIAASTLECIWARHIVDSAQLLDQATQWRSWLDLGAGAGFPGLVVALLGEGKVTLVESRAKRIGFLREAIEISGLADRVELVGSRVETLAARRYDVISARAFAPLDRLFSLASKFAGQDTRWILPKGKSAAHELEAARGTWQGRFELVPSITDSEAAIVVAEGVTPRKRR